MIHAVLIFNNHGKPRLSKFYSNPPHLATQQARTRLLAQIFALVSDRPSGLCNFLDAPGLALGSGAGSGAGAGKGKGRAEEEEQDEQDELRVIYRHYATLYFVFVVDGAESELGILDLIQVFVESLDRAFETVRELDIIFHFDEVLVVLAEIIQGGLVLETNINEIAANVHASAALRRASASSATPLLPASIAASLQAAAGGGGRAPAGRGGGGGGANRRSGLGGGGGGGATGGFGQAAGRWLSNLGAA